jgi:hypothetical protein
MAMISYKNADKAGSGLKPDPQIARLIPISRKVLAAIDSLGLSEEQAHRAIELATDIIQDRGTGKEAQAADELGAILKKGRSRSKALAAAILDVLQLNLPFITCPVPPDAFEACVKELGLEDGSTGARKPEDRGRA